MKIKQKIGRNDKCPCGSGIKYKKCHGAGGSRRFNPHTLRTEPSFERIIQGLNAREHQRREQQGLGRQIISMETNGFRFVVVGNSVLYSTKWKTFHDFLFDYIKRLLTSEWGNSEIARPIEDRHPIMQWYDSLCRMQKQYIKNQGEVSNIPLTGAVAAYLTLAYNLYLLAHNVKVQTRLIERLKNKRLFHGAYYETFVAAAFIVSGFDIEIENEKDNTVTHCEFIATSKTSGKKYSVEAKARHVPGRLGADVDSGVKKMDNISNRRRLRAALSKMSKYKRVIFIDVNTEDTHDIPKDDHWYTGVTSELRKLEYSMQIDGNKAPEAYIFFTNFPYHYVPDDSDFRCSVVADSFRIPEFKFGQKFNLRQALIARDNHKDMHNLWVSFKNQNIPSTFDGELPEYAFGFVNGPRMIVGNRYLVPDKNGAEVVGILEDAVVIESQKRVFCIYEIEGGRRIIAINPISDIELDAYRRCPETFFGVMKKERVHVDDPIDFYDFLYSTYKNSSKEELLSFMEKSINISTLKHLTQEELAKIFCEGIVSQELLRRASRPKK